jgi:hypothetical protein
MTIDGLYYGVSDFMVTVWTQLEYLKTVFEELRETDTLTVVFARDAQLLKEFRDKVAIQIEPLRQSFATWEALTPAQQQHQDKVMRLSLQSLYTKLTEVQLGLGPMQMRLASMT